MTFLTEKHAVYRPDIDGLRAFAVLVVLVFHSGIDTFSGGFVGVDVFFVISGFLITSLIFLEIREGRFSFVDFYQRRIARILPAALITLLLVFCFAFFLSPPEAFQKLGKDIVYSSFGMMNILLGQGVDYFANDGKFQPLVHFWSLGVEEQFYVVWPIFLLVAIRFGFRTILIGSALLLIASLAASIWAIEASSRGSYYLIQYRAFELLIGAMLALVIHEGYLPAIGAGLQRLVSGCATVLLVVPVFVLNSESRFPGINALWPCIGTALLLAYPGKGLPVRILSAKPLVWVGLISYPLYLYHQPVLEFYHKLVPDSQPFESLLLVLALCIPLAWLTWAYVERPIRRLVKSNLRTRYLCIWSLLILIPAVAAAGFFTFKHGGYPKRFQHLNPFAVKMSEATVRSFRTDFKGGFQVSSASKGGILFVGDSTMQQYVVPIVQALGLDVEIVDTVTRGGCVFLKGVDFVSPYAGSSCNELRNKLYELDKQWDTVVISQHWRTDTEKVRNLPKDAIGLEQWAPFLQATLDHFSVLSNKLVIIGDHAYSSGTELVEANIWVDSVSYGKMRDTVRVTNVVDMQDSLVFFDNFSDLENVSVIHPVNILCDPSCTTHDGVWTFFRDRLHFTNSATGYLRERIQILLGFD